MQSRFLPPLTEFSVALTSLTVGPVAVCSTALVSSLSAVPLCVALCSSLSLFWLKAWWWCWLKMQKIAASPHPSAPPSAPPPFYFLVAASFLHIPPPSVISVCHLLSPIYLYTPLSSIFWRKSYPLSAVWGCGGVGGGDGGAAINVRGLLKWDHRSESSRVSVKWDLYSGRLRNQNQESDQ